LQVTFFNFCLQVEQVQLTTISERFELERSDWANFLELLTDLTIFLKIDPADVAQQ
jgi:hypothetical protein